MPYEGCAIDTTTNTFRGDFVIVHEYDPTKELIKFPEGTQIFPPGSVSKSQYIYIQVDNKMVEESETGNHE